MGLRLVPGGLAGLCRLLRRLPLGGGELGLARARDTVADVGGMRMHRDLRPRLGMEIEDANPRVFEQHRKVVRGHLHWILRLGRARREEQGKREARCDHPWGHLDLLRLCSPCFLHGYASTAVASISTTASRSTNDFPSISAMAGKSVPIRRRYTSPKGLRLARYWAMSVT